MLVVADSSPLIVLINIEHIDILPRLFGKVVIPPEVSTELTLSNRPEPVRAFITSNTSNDAAKISRSGDWSDVSSVTKSGAM
jgi:predicted nucleic acid-binding protein